MITSASSFGRILSDITLTVNDQSGTLVPRAHQHDHRQRAEHAGPGRRPGAGPSREDPAVDAVVDQYVEASAPLANQVIGRVAGNGDLTRTGSRSANRPSAT